MDLGRIFGRMIGSGVQVDAVQSVRINDPGQSGRRSTAPSQAEFQTIVAHALGTTGDKYGNNVAVLNNC